MNYDIERNIIFNMILIFCRVSPIISFLPGSIYIPTTIKIVLSIIFSILISETIKVDFIEKEFIYHFLAETVIGIFIALVIHILFMTINTAGGIINSVSGISAANIFDITINNVNPIIGKFFSTIFVAFFFASNMHLIIIMGIIKSYEIFHYNNLFSSSNDFIYYISEIISKVFEMSLKISAPIIVISVLLYVSIGIINKMIPYLQVFFIFIPMHIWISFFIIFLYISNVFVWFSNEFLFIINELTIKNN